MSFEDLQKHEIFLPRSEWGKLNLSTSVNRTAVLLCGGIGLAGCVMMATGQGRPTTWIGVGLFLLFLFGFTLVSCRGVERQNREVEELTGEGREKTGASD